MAVRSQPHRLDWLIQPESLEDCSHKLSVQFESADQMFQTLFEDLSALNDTVSALSTSTSATGSGSTGVSMAKVLTRVMVRN